MTTQKKGILCGLGAGLNWALYTVLIYEILNLYAGSIGDIHSLKGIVMIVESALIIGVFECTFALCIEVGYLCCIRRVKEFIRILFSKTSLGILPAAIFAGFMGAVPYSIASSFSTSVAGTISAAFPAIGAIVATIWFKEKLTPLKFTGIILCVVGTGVMYGLSTGQTPLFVYLIAGLCAIGYAFEGCFGYNMMRQEIHSTITAALRRVYLIVLEIILILIIAVATKNFGYIPDFVSSFTVNSHTYPWLSGLEGNWIFLFLILFLGAGCNGLSYICWYYSFDYCGVATAQGLDITYGMWIVLLCSLPPFFATPAIGTICGAITVFVGAIFVTKASAS